jgi:hypothetical protein
MQRVIPLPDIELMKMLELDGPIRFRYEKNRKDHGSQDILFTFRMWLGHVVSITCKASTKKFSIYFCTSFLKEHELISGYIGN